MTRIPEENYGFDPLIVEAVDWLVRLTSGQATADDAEALAMWRAQSPAHEQAFRQVAGMRAAARAIKSTQREMNRRAMLAGGVAVAVGGLGLINPPLGLWPSISELTADHRTSTGERMAFKPAPGVQVELNSRTSVKLIDGSDGIGLIDGEAYLAIERSAPFLIEVQSTRLITQRTSVNIQLADDQVRIACLSGNITCVTSSSSGTVHGGTLVTIDAGGQVHKETASVENEVSWRHGLLIFENRPLAEVISQINRYYSGRIILANSEVGSRPVNGVFHTRQIEQTVTQLQQLMGLKLKRLPGGIALLG